MSGRTEFPSLTQRAWPRCFFFDLDQSFASTFGYDPEAAKKYEAAQATQEAQSDALRVKIEGKSPDPIVENANPVSSAAVSTGLTEDQRATMQAKIASLEQDIAFMQGEEAKRQNKGTYEIWNGVVNTEGAYAQKIVDEKAQVVQLQAQSR